jgi:transposase
LQKEKEGWVKHILLENETKPKKTKKEGRTKGILLGIK